MSKVTLTNVKRSDVRLAVISTGGSVPSTGYKFSDLVAAADWSRFDPTYLAGATSKAGIVHIGQFRGYPRDMWSNQERSGSFQKQCSEDGTGSYHTYTVPADTYFSFDSQDAANTLAQNDVNANGQEYANNHSEGYCTWYNDALSGTYSKEGCGYKGEGSTIGHSIAAGTKSSIISKSDANAQAQAEMDSVGQDHVNTYGYCTWYSEARTDNFQRDNCGDYGTGSYETVSASENQFNSTDSLGVANAARDAWMQAQANANGSCSYSFPSEARAADIQKEGCGYKGEGSWVYVSASEGQFTSPSNIAAANSLRDAWMQTQANANGYCTWYSEARTDSIQKDNCGSGQTGSYETVSASENQFSSTDSLGAANAARDAWMQAQANANGSCSSSCPDPVISISFLSMSSSTEASYAVTISNASGRTYNISANTNFGLPASILADDGNGNIIVKKTLNDILSIDVFFYGGSCGISGVSSQDIMQMQGVPHNGATTPTVSQNKYCVDGAGEKAMLTAHAPSGGILMWSNGDTGSSILVEQGTYIVWACNSSGASSPSSTLYITICF